MSSEPIITSLLDTDLYKLTMMNGVRHVAPDAEVEYTFVCRTPGANAILVKHVLPRLREQLDHLCSLRFSSTELEWLRAHISYLPSSFVQFYLRGFSLLSSCVDTKTDEEGRFYLKIRGPWLDTILFEVPVLSIIEQLWMDHQHELHPDLHDVMRRNLDAKIDWWLRGQAVHFNSSVGLPSLTDMGTRRRCSKNWHRFVIQELADRARGYLTGTSNVLFAKELGLRCFGTMAHEWVQAFQGMTRFDLSQKVALNAWQRVYGGDLGIALSDTLGTGMFLRDFDVHLANAYTGVRHDSGPPIEWAFDMIRHFEDLGIDPKTKTLVFSDSLNFRKMFEIFNAVNKFAKCGFGIGTYLTNDSDVAGEKLRIDIVIKMTMFDGHPVIKVSNDIGKMICECDDYAKYAMAQIHRRVG